MAKKCFLQRELKRSELIIQYAPKRRHFKTQRDVSTSLRTKLEFQFALQKLPRNSSPIRQRNRCKVTGRPRGYYRDFGLSRHVLREYAHKGFLPGLVKSSW